MIRFSMLPADRVHNETFENEPLHLADEAKFSNCTFRNVDFEGSPDYMDFEDCTFELTPAQRDKFESLPGWSEKCVTRCVFKVLSV